MAGSRSGDRDEGFKGRTLPLWIHSFDASWEQGAHSPDQFWGQGTSPLAVINTVTTDITNGISGDINSSSINNSTFVTSAAVTGIANSIVSGDVINSSININDSININSTTTVLSSSDDGSPFSGAHIFGIIFGTLMALFLSFLAWKVWYYRYQCVIGYKPGDWEDQVRGPIRRGARWRQKRRSRVGQICRWVFCCGCCRIERRRYEADNFSDTSTELQQTQSTTGDRSVLDRLADRVNASMLSFTRYFYRYHATTRHPDLRPGPAHQSYSSNLSASQSSHYDANQSEDAWIKHGRLQNPAAMLSDQDFSSRVVSSSDQLTLSDSLRSSNLKKSAARKGMDTEPSLFLESDQYTEDSFYLGPTVRATKRRLAAQTAAEFSAQVTKLGGSGDRKKHTISSETDTTSRLDQRHDLPQQSSTSVQIHGQGEITSEENKPLLHGRESDDMGKFPGEVQPVETESVVRCVYFSSESGSNGSLADDNLGLGVHADVKSADFGINIPSTGSAEAPAHEKPSNDAFSMQNAPHAPCEVTGQVHHQHIQKTAASNQMIVQDQEFKKNEKISSTKGSGQSIPDQGEASGKPHLSSSMSSSLDRLRKYDSSHISANYPCFGEKSSALAEDKGHFDSIHAERATSSMIQNSNLHTPCVHLHPTHSLPPGPKDSGKTPTMGIKSRLRAVRKFSGEELTGAQVTDHRECVKCFPQDQSTINFSLEASKINQDPTGGINTNSPLMNKTYTIWGPDTSHSAKRGTEDSHDQKMNSSHGQEWKRADTSNTGTVRDEIIDSTDQSVTRNEGLTVDVPVHEGEKDPHHNPDTLYSDPSSEQHSPDDQHAHPAPKLNRTVTRGCKEVPKDSPAKSSEDGNSPLQGQAIPFSREQTIQQSARPRNPESTISYKAVGQASNVTVIEIRRDKTTVYKVMGRQLSDPARPSSRDPAHPCVHDPAQPCVHDPTQPSSRDPAQPCDHDPARPSSRDPAQPCVHDPAQPCVHDPARPSSRDPARPSSRDPARPCSHTEELEGAVSNEQSVDEHSHDETITNINLSSQSQKDSDSGGN